MWFAGYRGGWCIFRLPTMSTHVDIPLDTDVVLLVRGQRFYCNRNRLSEASGYFEAMFRVNMKEKAADVIELQGVEPKEMKVLYAYIECGIMPELEILPETKEADFLRVRCLLEAAVMYQFEAISDYCAKKLLPHLKLATCLKLMFLADRLGLPELLVQSKQMCLWKFETLKEDASFLALPCSLLVEYLSHDELRVKSECSVFYSIVHWVDHDPEQRLPVIDDALSVVRFSDMNLPELKTISHIPLVISNCKVKRIIHEIWKIKFDRYMADRMRRGATSAAITPLSGISPAESVHGLDAAVASEEDDYADSPASMKLPLAMLKNVPERVLKGLVREEKLIARQLLVAGPRVLPMFPGFILRNSNNAEAPQILAYNHHQKTMMMLGTLTKAIEMSQVALGFVACIKGTCIYVTGGEFVLGRNNFNNSMWRYDTFTKRWQLAARLASSRRHHTVCVMDDDIYMIGGIGRFRIALRSVERFNVRTGNWSTAASIPNPIQYAPAAVYKGKIYVLETQVYRYDVQQNSWTLLSNIRLPHEIGFHSAMAHANGIYLVGRYRNDVVLFCPEALTEGKASKDVVRVVGRLRNKTDNACMLGDTIYTFSNSDNLAVEAYDINTNTSRVEYECQDGSLAGSSTNYGCFLIPKYL